MYLKWYSYCLIRYYKDTFSKLVANTESYQSGLSFLIKICQVIHFHFYIFIHLSSRMELFLYNETIVDRSAILPLSLKQPQQLRNVKCIHIFTFRERVVSNVVLHMQMQHNFKIHKITLFSNLNWRIICGLLVCSSVDKYNRWLQSTGSFRKSV